jgi:hypothetical protein
VQEQAKISGRIKILFFWLQDELVKSSKEPGIAEMYGDKFPSLVRKNARLCSFNPSCYSSSLPIFSQVFLAPCIRKVAFGIAIERMFEGLM